MLCNIVPTPKSNSIIRVRMDLDEITSEEFQYIQNWPNSGSRTEVIRFCIHQIFLFLKREGRKSILEMGVNDPEI